MDSLKKLYKTGREYTINTHAVQWTSNNARSAIQSVIGGKFEANQIAENVYVGSFSSACDYESLRRHKIEYVVVAAYGLWKMYPTDFKYKRVPVIDSEYSSLAPYFQEVADFIYEAAVLEDKKVLIHCVAGVSRSAALAAAYLILTQGRTVNEAIRELQKWRPQINPNDTFRAELGKLTPNFLINSRGPQHRGSLPTSFIDGSNSKPKSEPITLGLDESFEIQPNRDEFRKAIRKSGLDKLRDLF